MKNIARKCKCAISGEYGTTDEFVKIGTKYYKSQDIYDADRHEKQTRKDLVDYICKEFLDYYEGQPFPPTLPVKLKELEFYSNEVILETFKQSRDNIYNSFNKIQFRNDAAKVAYMFAIIKNNIAEIYRQYKQQSKKTKSAIEIDETIDIENINSKQKVKDIGDWLGEDEF